MSFFSSSSFKPHTRQEGFHLPSPDSSSATTPPPTVSSPFDSFPSMATHPSYLPDPFRRGSLQGLGTNHSEHPSSAGMDFEDLASFISANSPPHQHPHSHERSTHSPASSISAAAPGSYHQPEDHQHRPHNIFDTSAPSTAHQPHHHFQQPSSVSSNTSSSFPNSSSHDFASHFNSTLPALSSSMRYEPHPDPPSATSTAPPSSFPSSQFRHTPSPTVSSHHPHSQRTATTSSRSRSRSRPPSSSNGPGSVPGATSTNGGPARTTRPRRNGSVSSTSPPPSARPQAILIPGSKGHNHGHGPLAIGGAPLSPLNISSGTSNGNGNGNGWLAATSEYSLPTPDSMHSHPSPSHHHTNHHHHHASGSSMTGNGYSPFGLSPPSSATSTTAPNASNSNNNGQNSNVDIMHLPPASSLSHYPSNGSNMMHHGSGPSPHVGSPSYVSPSGISPVSPGGLGGLSSMGMGMSGMISGMGNMMNGMPGISGMIGSSSLGLNAVSSNPPVPSNGPVSGVPVVPGVPASPTVLTAAEKQAMLVNEKRRRRRESHNAVERRRRDNINEKISELATLIPECMLDIPGSGNGSSNAALLSPTDDALLPSPLEAWPTKNGGDGETKKEDGAVSPIADNGEGPIVKANKGMILRKSVEYIRYLQQLVTAQGARNRELEQELKGYRTAAGVNQPQTTSPTTSTASSSGNTSDGSLSCSEGTSVTSIDDNGQPKSHVNGNDALGSPPESGIKTDEHALSQQGNAVVVDGHDDMSMVNMMLHDEVGFGNMPSGGSQSGSALSPTQHHVTQSRHKRRTSSFGGFGGMLPTMPEGIEGEEVEDEDLDDRDDGDDGSHEDLDSEDSRGRGWDSGRIGRSTSIRGHTKVQRSQESGHHHAIQLDQQDNGHPHGGFNGNKNGFENMLMNMSMVMGMDDNLSAQPHGRGNGDLDGEDAHAHLGRYNKRLGDDSADSHEPGNGTDVRRGRSNSVPVPAPTSAGTKGLPGGSVIHGMNLSVGGIDFVSMGMGMNPNMGFGMGMNMGMAVMGSSPTRLKQEHDGEVMETS